MKAADYTPFFILGQPRSGTTALARLLNASPQVACLDYEGNILYRLWQTLQRREVLTEPLEDLLADFEVTARHNLVDRTPQPPDKKNHFSEENIRELLESFRQGLETSPDPADIYRKVSATFFDIFSENSKASIIGDKVPDYIHIPEQITAPHPTSLVIAITRDPRAVIHSSLKFNQSRLHLFAVQSAFAMAVAYCLKQKGLEKFLDALPSHRFLSLRQEEVLNSPQQVFERSCRFFKLSGPDGSAQGNGMVQVRHWENEMRQADVEAVNAVCSVFRVLDAEENFPEHWQAKAESGKSLSSCADSEIPEQTRKAAGAFPGKADKKELGLTLAQMADYAHRSGQFPRAAALYSEASAFIPNDSMLWYKYAMLSFDMKLLDQARQFSALCQTHCPPTKYHAFLRAKNQYLAGMISRLQGDTEMAISYFETSLRVKGDFALPRRMLELLRPATYGRIPMLCPRSLKFGIGARYPIGSPEASPGKERQTKSRKAGTP